MGMVNQKISLNNAVGVAILNLQVGRPGNLEAVQEEGYNKICTRLDMGRLV